MADYGELKPFDYANYQPPTLDEQSGRWNGWRLVTLADGTWIEYPAYQPGTYPVDLEDLTTSARVLDIVCQVAGKGWATDACLAGLVHILNDILHPQANLCSCGTNKTLTPVRIRQLARR